MPEAVKKRTKSIPNWTVWLSALTVANVLFGLWFSSSTSLQKVKIQGATVDDEPRITKELQHVAGVPAWQVRVLSLVSAMNANPEVFSATAQTNIFGRGLIQIKLKEPVAVIGEDPSVALALDGSSFVTKRPLDDLPGLVIDPAFTESTFALTGGWESERIAWTAKQIATKVKKTAWLLSINARGVLSLKENARGEVIFGTTENIAQKFGKFEQALLQEPKLLDQVSELNVSSPGDVTTKP